jgi:pimeloyl-ACP methyl ester carboxylesterase
MAITTAAFPTNSVLRAVPDDYFPVGSERWFTIPDGHDAGKTMFYYDIQIGGGSPTSTVVFVHGNPECSYTYRHIRDALAGTGVSCRVVAMDHVGFGLSDQASYEMVDTHHAANLVQLVQQLDLSNVTLVIHDWGGPIGVGAFIDEPQRVDNLLLMNTTIFPMPGDGLTYTNYPVSWLPWCKTPLIVPDRFWGALAAYVVSHAAPQGTLRFMYGVLSFMVKDAFGVLTRKPDTPESVWCGQMASRNNAKSSQRNVLQTPVWGHGYTYEDPVMGEQDNRAFYRNMQDKIAEVWGPSGRNIGVAGYFGSWDPCGKDSVIRQWQSALPRLKERTYVYPDVGHFIEEYKGAEMAQTIRELNGDNG